MEESVVPLLMQTVLAVVVSCVFVFVGYLFSTKRYSKKKMDTYECGVDPIGRSAGAVNIKFYVIAVLFILFEIEILFFLPFAAVFNELKRSGTHLQAFVEIMSFAGVLAAGYIYILAKRVIRFKD